MRKMASNNRAVIVVFAVALLMSPVRSRAVPFGQDPSPAQPQPSER